MPFVVRDAPTEDADRAVENITRKQPSPYEEAKAVRAMLERGLTEDGAAQALGWPKQRVTARGKILELPERAQQLIGEGVIHLALLPVHHQPHRAARDVEAEHRQHAVVELAIRDLKDQALADFPSGRFNANAAWTVIACLAHNLLR